MWSIKVTIKPPLIGTPFNISHYPKRFEGFATKNRESLTRGLKHYCITQKERFGSYIRLSHVPQFWIRVDFW